MILAMTFLALTLPAPLTVAGSITWLEPRADIFEGISYGQPILETPSPTVADAHAIASPPRVSSPSEINQVSSTALLFNSDDVELINHIVMCNDLSQKIDRFAFLPATWAGSDTVLPSPKIRSSAKSLLRALSSDNSLPQVTLSADGEIEFVWYGHDCRVEALLGPDDHLVWFGEFAGVIEGGGDVEWKGAIPGGLLEMIERLQV
jgi:hypothetical protein